jgi:hypothetical protein
MEREIEESISTGRIKYEKGYCSVLSFASHRYLLCIVMEGAALYCTAMYCTALFYAGMCYIHSCDM